jgi:hypothetical protein
MSKPLSWNAEGERILNEWRECGYPAEGELRNRVAEWAKESRRRIDEKIIRMLQRHPKLWGIR